MNTNQYLSGILKKEGGKSQIKMGDARQFHKLQIQELAKGCSMNEYGDLSFLPGSALDMLMKQIKRELKKK